MFFSLGSSQPASQRENKRLANGGVGANHTTRQPLPCTPFHARSGSSPANFFHQFQSSFGSASVSIYAYARMNILTSCVMNIMIIKRWTFYVLCSFVFSYDSLDAWSCMFSHWHGQVFGSHHSKDSPTKVRLCAEKKDVYNNTMC